jgi:hypothetical protein
MVQQVLKADSVVVLFICGLFNDAVNSSDYTASKFGKTDE